MSEPTKTISFRVPLAIADQIDAVATAHGQNMSQWVRQQAMQTLHTGLPPATENNRPSEPFAIPVGLGEAIEARIQQAENRLWEEISPSGSR